MKLGWYVQRLRRMAPGEVAWRLRNMLLQRLWRRRQGLGEGASSRLPGSGWSGTTTETPLPEGGGALVGAAQGILDGRWRLFDRIVDLSAAAPDWFRDPVTGLRSDPAQYCFDVPYRRQDVVGNVKYVWETSRLHHVTVLAAAWHLTRDDRFADRALDHLQSWWRDNPPLSGIHWLSGIELGQRLLAWVWTRRLLAGRPGIAAAFEDNPLFLDQLQAHQRWLATFYSRGSSANNHLIAEMAGQYAAAVAFPLFPDSAAWARQAAAILAREVVAQTFTDGLNREMAAEYHPYVLELLLLAALEGDAAQGNRVNGHSCPRPLRERAESIRERVRGTRVGAEHDRFHHVRTAKVDSSPASGRSAPSPNPPPQGGRAAFLFTRLPCDAAGHPLPDVVWDGIRRMADALAANVDERRHPSRQGDGDDGRGLIVDDPGRNRVDALLELCGRLLGAAPWWPPIETGSVLAAVAAPLGRHRALPCPVRRSHTFPDAGVTLLRDLAPRPDAVWCRVDHGPHGFLATTAHAHADALSFELRVGGVEVLVDPGTYCYHGEPDWRRFFRSTLAHNTLEVGGLDQAIQGGPFLWLSRPESWCTAARGLDDGDSAELVIGHDGYRKPFGALHHRRLRFDRVARRLDIEDWLEAADSLPVRLAFHLGPAVDCRLDGATAHLCWDGGGAALILPESLAWSATRGAVDPPLGWYSPGFGQRQPSTSLIGTGQLAIGARLLSRIELTLSGDSPG